MKATTLIITHTHTYVRMHAHSQQARLPHMHTHKHTFTHLLKHSKTHMHIHSTNSHSLPLSFSHTHTHTHTRKNTGLSKRSFSPQHHATQPPIPNPPSVQQGKIKHHKKYVYVYIQMVICVYGNVHRSISTNKCDYV